MLHEAVHYSLYKGTFTFSQKGMVSGGFALGVRYARESALELVH